MLFRAITWWYGAGWAALARRVMERIDRVQELFSVGLLAKTLFAPFRQIDAGAVQGPLAVRVRAFGDRLFSRVFGAVLRSVVIVVGLLTTLLVAVGGVLQLALWPCVPLLPLVGLIAMLASWRIG